MIRDCVLSAVILVFIFGASVICTVKAARDDGYQYQPYHENDRVRDRPIFRPTQNNYTHGPGERAVMKCRVENLGTKQVTWRREGEQHPLTIGLFTFVSDTRISVDYNQRMNEWSLIINPVRPEDQGIYYCTVATSMHINNTYEINLNVRKEIVLDRPAVMVSGERYIEEGRPVQLVCNATGRPDPPQDVKWYKDGMEMDSNKQNGVLITKKIEPKMLISVLVIHRSSLNDAGHYVCRSSNKDNASIFIQILDVADPNKNKRDSNANEHLGARQTTYNGSNRNMSALLAMLCTLLISRLLQTCTS